MKGIAAALCLTLALALVALVGAGSAGAGEVRLTQCINTGGNVTTTPGSLDISLGWGTSQLGNMNKFLRTNYVIVSVTRGTQTSGLSTIGAFGWTNPVLTPLPDGRIVYISRYLLSLGVIASGETVSIRFELWSTQKVYDDQGLEYGGAQGGLISAINCVITAT